jgi:hypothetical protein
MQLLVENTLIKLMFIAIILTFSNGHMLLPEVTTKHQELERKTQFYSYGNDDVGTRDGMLGWQGCFDSLAAPSIMHLAAHLRKRGMDDTKRQRL